MLAPDGTVSDASVIGGPMELRKAALSSVLTWHFGRGSAPRQQVSVQFSLKAGAVTVPRLVLEPVPGAPAASSPAADLHKPEVLLRLIINGLSQQAEEELRSRLQLQVGQTIDDAAFQRAREVVRQFDDNLRLGETWVNMGTPTGGVWLTVYPPDRGSVRPEHGPASTSGSPLSGISRRLHVDIQGLPPEAAAELRQRLAVRDGETLDYEAFQKELARIHQVVNDFDPHLKDSRAVARVPRNLGPDGKLIPPDSIDVTIIISLQNPAAQAGGLEQYGRIAKP